MNAAALLWRTLKGLLCVMFKIRFLTSDTRLDFFRAPEIYLGQPVTEAIDVWGVGCVLAYLFTGRHLYPVHCEYQNVCMLNHTDSESDVQHCLII